MIIWLASYPRSGNTFFRVILNQLYGLNTYSIYGDIEDIAADKGTSDIVGHTMLPESVDYSELRADKELYVIKTHGHPDASMMRPEDKVVYLVRNGLESTWSYYNHINQYESSKIKLESILSGNVRFGTWGDHVYAWAPKDRDNVLCIKFEDLVDSPLSSVEDISKFFGINTVADKIPTFDELQKINPKFFRSGKKDSWRETVTVEQKKIFWEKNFLSMIDFDYDLEADCGQGKMIYRSVKSAAKILSTYGRINPHQIDNSDHWRLDGMFDFFQSEIKKKNELLDVFQGEIKKKNELLNGAWEASNSLVGEKNKLEVELSNAALQLSELAVERDGLINEFSVERDGLISDFSVERDGLKNALQECLSQLNNTKNLLNINSADIVSLKNRNLHFFEEFDAVKNSTSLRLGRAIVLPISSLLARGRKIWRFLTPSRQELRNRIVLNKLKRKFSKDPSQFSVAFELAIVQGRLGNNKEAVRLMRKVARSSYKESREAQLFLSGKSST